MDKDVRLAMKRGPRGGIKFIADGRDCVVLCTCLREDKATADGVVVLYRALDTYEERLVPLKKWPNAKARRENQGGRWTRRPEDGSRWRHYKGGIYTVVTNAFLDETGEHFVVYKAAADGTVWARSIESWLTATADGQPRFVPAP